MNCEECTLMLDDYIENELSGKKVAEIDFHLNQCQQCADYCELLRREHQIFSQFLTHIRSNPDSWDKLESGIEKYQRSHFYFFHRVRSIFGVSFLNPVYLSGTAILILITGLIIGTVRYWSESYPSTPNVLPTSNERNLIPDKSFGSEPVDKITTAKSQTDDRKNEFQGIQIKSPGKERESGVISGPKSLSRNSLISADKTVVKSEREYLSAIAILSRDLKKQRKHLTPGRIELLEKSLPNLDKTINEARRAVRTQPRDTVAIQYMTAAYAKKVELLRMIIGD